jgi:CheY-like chemotaxis protein
VTKTNNILVIEDDELLRDLYEMILSSKGYTVKTAEHGQAALKVLQNFSPDLILLDLFMPVMNGEEFLTAMQPRDNYPNTKIILFSNVSDARSFESLYRLGISNHVLKSSMLPNDLVELINVTLNQAA